MPANPSLQPEDRPAIPGQLAVPPPAAYILPPGVPQLVTRQTPGQWVHDHLYTASKGPRERPLVKVRRESPHKT